MQDEEMDMRIRDAANQHHPPYDDKAWGKMEQLLDKHLPHKKDRRRWFFLLFLFLLLDTGILLFIVKPWKGNSPAVAGNNISKDTPSASQEAATSTHNTGNATDMNKPGIKPEQSQQTNISPVSQTGENSRTATTVNVNSPVSVINQNASAPAGKRKTVSKDKDRFSTTITVPGTVSDNNKDLQPMAKKQTDAMNNDSKTKTAVPDKNWLTSSVNKNSIINTPDNTAKSIAKEALVDNKKNIAAEKIKEQEKPVSPSKDKKKTTKGFGNNFGLTVSVGAELNFVSLDNPGKITPLYGAGLSYTFAKRFTVRTGFYVTEKVYPATPEQYNNTIYPNLTAIDANCKVYQVPLSIGYNFGQRKNHCWFGSVGLSSLLMKKEVYKYEYKTAGGQYYYYDHTVNNENKHYFSVLSLSAGYQYNLNNRFSIMAEPFLNLPLKGIGYGKIKLNSTGALLTLSVKPFAKKNK